jgi:hypothetical protein
MSTKLLPENRYYWSRGSSWVKRVQGETLRWHVFDDRKLYKPGEEVQLKGWARRVHLGRGGGVEGLPSSVTSLAYEVFDPRGNKIASGTASMGGLGGFDLKFKLPDNANLGHARVSIHAQGSGLPGATTSHGFQIQEFRRPEFEVKSTASEGLHLVGGKAEVSATASYYAGGGLPNADVTWRVTTSDGHFVPPKRHEYVFVGSNPAWWRRPSSAVRRGGEIPGR